MKKRILLIEDEKRLLRVLELFLIDNGYEVQTAINGQLGIEILKQWTPDLVISDLKMKPVDGMEVLKFGRLNFPNVPFILLTAFGSVETAVTAMKYGALDFITKPVNHKHLLEVIEQVFVSNANDNFPLDSLIGSSAKMEEIKKEILMFASTDSSVLINGESGTGKEITARAIHKSSKRVNGPFIKVNCAAIPRELIESELFGHKKGAFTGALHDRTGAFILADKGVLFLDEIGDLPIELQPKLLHAVEEKTITPIGSSKVLPVSVKILSATNLNLETMAKESKFRADLYYRLNTVCIHMPALREKKEDIRELTRFFIQKYCHEFKKPLLKISDDTIKALKTYPWPGNVRELKNFIERAVITCSKDTITPDYLPDSIKERKSRPATQKDENMGFDLASQEQNLLFAALKKWNWHQSNTARGLGITRSALRYRLQKYGIKRD